METFSSCHAARLLDRRGDFGVQDSPPQIFDHAAVLLFHPFAQTLGLEFGDLAKCW